MMDLLQSDTGKRNAYAMINPVGMKHGGSGFLVGTVISCDDVTDNTELELADSNTETNSAAAAMWGWWCPYAGLGIYPL